VREGLLQLVRLIIGLRPSDQRHPMSQNELMHHRDSFH
jgi:hypothetical protein